MTSTGTDQSNVIELKYFQPSVSAETFGARDASHTGTFNLSGSSAEENRYVNLHRSNEDQLSAQVLRKLDPDTELAKFFDFAAIISSNAILTATSYRISCESTCHHVTVRAMQSVA